MTRSSLVLAILLAGCASRPGVDRIVVGKVWTADPATPAALAIVGGKVVYRAP